MDETDSLNMQLSTHHEERSQSINIGESHHYKEVDMLYWLLHSHITHSSRVFKCFIDLILLNKHISPASSPQNLLKTLQSLTANHTCYKPGQVRKTIMLMFTWYTGMQCSARTLAWFDQMQQQLEPHRPAILQSSRKYKCQYTEPKTYTVVHVTCFLSFSTEFNKLYSHHHCSWFTSESKFQKEALKQVLQE